MNGSVKKEDSESKSNNITSLKFVNNKSTQRMSDIVNKLRDSYVNPPEISQDSPATNLLNKIEEDPVRVIYARAFVELGENFKPENKLQSKLSFMELSDSFLPAKLPMISAQNIGSKYSKRWLKFYYQLSNEHHRLLWSYQDRINNNMKIGKDGGYKSEFVSAAEVLNKDMHHSVFEEDFDSARQCKSILQISQNLAKSVLERENKWAKMIQEAEQFQNEHILAKSGDLEVQYKAANVDYPFSVLRTTHDGAK